MWGLSLYNLGGIISEKEYKNNFLLQILQKHIASTPPMQVKGTDAFASLASWWICLYP